MPWYEKVVKYVQSCLHLLFCSTDLNVCFYDSTMIFLFIKKLLFLCYTVWNLIGWSLQHFCCWGCWFYFIFFFLRQDLIVYSLLVWNSQIGIYQAGLELIDICLLLPPECWDSRHAPPCSVSISIWGWDCFSYHVTFMLLLEFQDLFFLFYSSIEH